MLGPTHSSPRAVGRYLLAGPIAVGGMASVHFGLLNGPRGFRRTVAIKRMLQTYAVNPQARLMLVDEARLASRVSHANVVQTLDVVEDEDELFLVLEYVHGESFDKLLERAQELGQKAPPRVASAIVVGALRGLHAAHEAKDEGGKPLELVHRDLSPHNVLVDVNGVARVLDFGVARARGRLQGTRDGQLKGKLAYLAPEQVHGEASRRSDLFTAGVVLWEALAGRQLFRGNSEADLLSQVLLCKVPSLAELGVEVAPALQAVLDQALARAPEDRFATAAQLADALEACGVACAAEVAGWVKDLAADTLAQRTAALEGLEKLPAPDALAPPAPARPGPGAPAAVPRAPRRRRRAGAAAGGRRVGPHRRPPEDARRGAVRADDAARAGDAAAAARRAHARRAHAHARRRGAGAGEARHQAPRHREEARAEAGAREAGRVVRPALHHRCVRREALQARVPEVGAARPLHHHRARG